MKEHPTHHWSRSSTKHVWQIGTLSAGCNIQNAMGTQWASFYILFQKEILSKVDLNICILFSWGCNTELTKSKKGLTIDLTLGLSIYIAKMHHITWLSWNDWSKTSNIQQIYLKGKTQKYPWDIDHSPNSPIFTTSTKCHCWHPCLALLNIFLQVGSGQIIPYLSLSMVA